MEGLKTRRARRLNMSRRALKKNSAASYSPTQLPEQYHRR